METLFLHPSTLQEALSVANQYQDKAVFINGGTDLTIEISQKRKCPERIIYLGNLQELSKIQVRDKTLVIGGAVTFRQMQTSPYCRQYRGLVEAIHHLGSPAIRSVATPAGNAATAAASADCNTMLLALGASLKLENLRGSRIIPMASFFVSKNLTVLMPDEIITEIHLPVMKQGMGSGYSRLARRKAQDIGKVLVGAVLRLEADLCAEASISLGALNPTSVKAVSLEKTLAGKTKEAALKALKEQLPEEAKLRESYYKNYKETVIGTVIQRAVEMAWLDAEEGCRHERSALYTER